LAADYNDISKQKRKQFNLVLNFANGSP